MAVSFPNSILPLLPLFAILPTGIGPMAFNAGVCCRWVKKLFGTGIGSSGRRRVMMCTVCHHDAARRNKNLYIFLIFGPNFACCYAPRFNHSSCVQVPLPATFGWWSGIIAGANCSYQNGCVVFQTQPTGIVSMLML